MDSMFLCPSFCRTPNVLHGFVSRSLSFPKDIAFQTGIGQSLCRIASGVLRVVSGDVIMKREHPSLFEDVSNVAGM